MKRPYRVQRDGEFWSCIEAATGRAVLTKESFAVADQLALALNGGRGVCGEIWELAQALMRRKP